jgi:protein subunit release factor B
MPVSPDTETQLEARMAALGIKEADLVEKFVRASGPGGQKVNKTSSAVYLKHLPSGIEVKAQEHRSQAMNRFFARRILVERLERERLGKASAEEQRIEKIRRQKRKRSRRSKARMLADKRHTSAKKEGRRGGFD